MKNPCGEILKNRDGNIWKIQTIILADSHLHCKHITAWQLLTAGRLSLQSTFRHRSCGNDKISHWENPQIHQNHTFVKFVFVYNVILSLAERFNGCLQSTLNLVIQFSEWVLEFYAGWDTYPWPLLTIEWAYGMIEFQMPYVMRVRLRHSEFRSYAIQPWFKLHCHKPTYIKCVRNPYLK